MRKYTFLIASYLFLSPSIFLSDKIIFHKHVSKSRPSPLKLELAVASWYDEQFQGRPTANGETYDMFQISAAHKKLRLGTKVLFVSPYNGQRLVIRINDRGPYKPGRDYDLSWAAADRLGMVDRGVAKLFTSVLQ
jgi:rare lipoprotein A (peptidoglycan hydrolase)